MKTLLTGIRLSILISLTAWGNISPAHVMNYSSATINIDTKSVRIEWRISHDDAATIARQARTDQRDALTRYVLTGATLTSGTGHKKCRARVANIRRLESTMAVSINWRCPGVLDNLHYRVAIFSNDNTDARHIVLIRDQGGTRQAVLTRHNPELRITSQTVPDRLATIKRYLNSGVEHIFFGYDHIAFLIAVLLWAKKFMPVLSAVTAFTIAHSITLAFATLSIVTPPSAIVEILIAASIVYAAAENLISNDMSTRWRTTGILGLIHGFGFANVLREFGLPDDALLTALASFNAGIEAGQILIAAFLMAVLSTLEHLVPGLARNRSTVVIPASLMLIATGVFWFTHRVLLL